MIIDKLKKKENLYIDSETTSKKSDKSNSLIGRWIKCERCSETQYLEDVHKNLSVCPNCDNHFRLSSRRRIEQIIDKGTFEEILISEEIQDPLNFPDYKKKIEGLKKATGIKEAVRAGIGNINGHKVVISVMDANFMMGSMGSYVGELVTLSIETAIKRKLPLIIFTASRWCKNARRNSIFDANGQNIMWFGKIRTRRTFIHYYTYRPNNRRCDS